MIKYIALTAFIIASLSYVNTQATCGNSPVLPLLEKFIQSHDEHVYNPKRKNKNDDDKIFDGAALLTTFKAGTGAAVNDLSKCTDYNSGGDINKLTCCTNDLVKLFPRLTKGFFRRRMGKPPKPFKLVRSLKKLGKKCGASESDGIDTKEEVKNIMKTFKECQKNATLADVDLLRGTLCSLCVAPTDYTTYFQADSQVAENLKILATAENLNAYDSAIQAGLTCFDNAQASFTDLVNNITSTWDNSTCSAQIAIINEILANPQRKHGANKGCKGKAKPLQEGNGCLDELEDDEQDYPEQAGLQDGLQGGLQDGLQGGLQDGLQGGIQEGLQGQDGLQGGLQGGLQQGLQGGQGNRRFLSLQRILSTSTGGYIESPNGLNNVYSVDSTENRELAGEDIDDGVIGGETKKNNSAQIISYAMGLMALLLVALI